MFAIESSEVRQSTADVSAAAAASSSSSATRDRFLSLQLKPLTLVPTPVDENSADLESSRSESETPNASASELEEAGERETENSQSRHSHHSHSHSNSQQSINSSTSRSHSFSQTDFLHSRNSSAANSFAAAAALSLPSPPLVSSSSPPTHSSGHSALLSRPPAVRSQTAISPDSRRHSNSTSSNAAVMLISPPPFNASATRIHQSATNSPSTSPSHATRKLQRDSLQAIAPWSQFPPSPSLSLLPFSCCHSRDGVLIRYSTVGARSSHPALVFVHGFCGDSTYFTRQALYFSPRFNCVLIDLAGHGNSGQNRLKWTIESLSDDIRAVLKHANLDKTILIGHSIAGAAILHAAHSVGSKVVGLVGLDSLFATQIDYSPQSVELVNSLKSNFSETVRSMMSEAFNRVVDPAVKEYLIEDMSANNSCVAPLIAAHQNFNFSPLFQAIRCPILSLSWGTQNSATQQVEAIKSLIHSSAADRDYQYVNMGDVGHFMFLTHPEEVNRTIDQWIQTSGLAASNHYSTLSANSPSVSSVAQLSGLPLIPSLSSTNSCDASNSSSASASPIPTPRNFLASRTQSQTGGQRIDFEAAAANIINMSRIPRSSLSIAKPETPSSSNRSDHDTENSLTNSPLSAPIISPRLSASAHSLHQASQLGPAMKLKDNKLSRSMIGNNQPNQSSPASAFKLTSINISNSSLISKISGNSSAAQQQSFPTIQPAIVPAASNSNAGAGVNNSSFVNNSRSHSVRSHSPVSRSAFSSRRSRSPVSSRISMADDELENINNEGEFEE